MHNPVPSSLASLLGRVERISEHSVASGFSVTVEDWADLVVLTGSGTLATGTVTMPPAPRNGQVVTVITNQVITALTVSPNAGQGIYNAPTTLQLSRTTPSRVSGFGFSYVFVQAVAYWYRLN